jgi:hypothetical protein
LGGFVGSGWVVVWFVDVGVGAVHSCCGPLVAWLLARGIVLAASGMGRWLGVCLASALSMLGGCRAFRRFTRFMFRLVFSLRLVVVCSLAVLGLVAAGAAPAWAAEFEEEGATLGVLPFRSPSVKVCKNVPNAGPTGVYKGLYSDSHCLINTEKGLYAWATPGRRSGTWYCLLAPKANQLYTNELCQKHNTGAGAFLALWGAQRFPRFIGKLDNKQLLSSKIAGATINISCTAGSSELQGQTGSLSSEGDITYTGCTVENLPKCLVGSGKKLGEILTNNLVGTQETATLLNFTPEAGGAFVSLVFSNKGEESCAVKGEDEVTGSQMCTWIPGIESPAEEHDFTCRGTESNLKLGAITATYEGLVLAHFEGFPLFKIQ